MNRKDFIKTCGFACMGGLGIIGGLQGCSTPGFLEGSGEMLEGKIVGDNLVVQLSDFEIKKGKAKDFRKYIVVQNEILKYPVCVYRFSEMEYTALWMRCTHQGTELQVFGNQLQCPAHGSEFTNKGHVQNGPAENKLRTFPVTIDNKHLKISLKAA